MADSEYSDQKLRKKNDKYFLLILFISFFLYLWKIKRGMVTNDEAFYLSTPMRFLNGDAILSEEWNLSQLSALLILPILKIYLALFHSTEAIYYHFRMIYMCYQMLVSAISYLLLRKQYKTAPWMCAMYLLFVPYGLQALSYNTIALGCLIIISSMILADVIQKYSYASVIAGILYGCAVVSQPFLVIIWFVYLLFCIYYHLRKKEKSLCQRKIFWNVTAGIAVVAIICLLYIFHHSNLNDIFMNLDYILHDPTHQARTLKDMIQEILPYVASARGYFGVIAFCLIFSFFCNDENRRRYLFILAYLITILELIRLSVFNQNGYWVHGIGMNGVVFVMSILGILVCILQKSFPEENISVVYAISILYAIAEHLASNQSAYVICMAFLPASAAALSFIQQYCESHSWKKEFAVLITIQLLSEGYVFLTHFYWEYSNSPLNAELERGPAKGIFVTEGEKQQYDNILADMDQYCMNVRGPFYIFGSNQESYNVPLCYVYTDNEVGGPSTWSGTFKTLDAENLQKYYDLHPDKKPVLIYVLPEMAQNKEDTFDYQKYANDNEYSITVLSDNALLLQSKK